MKHGTDEYGVFSATRVAGQMFAAQQRHSGRTTRMIERCGEYDQIVVPTVAVAEHINRLLRDAGKKVRRVYVVHPREPVYSKVPTAPQGRTFFDHSWIEQFVEMSLLDAEQYLHEAQIGTSKTWPNC